jgi:hypothetical protein
MFDVNNDLTLLVAIHGVRPADLLRPAD